MAKGLSSTMTGTPPVPNAKMTEAIHYGNPDLDKPYAGGVLGQVTRVSGGELNAQPASLATTMENPLQLTFRKN